MATELARQTGSLSGSISNFRPAIAALAAALLLALVPLGGGAQEREASFEGKAESASRIAQALPDSRDALFGDEAPKPPPKKPATRDQLFDLDSTKPATPTPGSKEQLFGDDIPKRKPDAKEAASPPGITGTSGEWRGYVQSEFAYTYQDPEHWSKARARFELGRSGRLSNSLRYRVTGRVEYDWAYDIEHDFYPSEVRHDQRKDFQWRETYLDVSAGDFQLRLGRQHIIWGEVPGLFFADVVSARDMREFILADFDSLRIPQWAARAEYFAGDAHIEFIWIPWVTVDRFGKPGADFYPYPPPPPPGFDVAFRGERKPSQSIDNSNYGIRLSALKAGWDLSAFAYRSTDIEPTFYRDIVAAPVPTFVFKPRHDRITQFGGTLTKDLGTFVLKAEAVYSRDKGFSVQRLSDVDGIAKLDIFDYLIGADFSLGPDTNLYAYGFQRRFVQYDSDIVPDRVESGVTLQLTHKLTNTLELQALFITSINRSDWLFRPRATWNFARNWRMNVGVDILHGPPLGFFGRFADRDRIYTDIRYSF